MILQIVYCENSRFSILPMDRNPQKAMSKRRRKRKGWTSDKETWKNSERTAQDSIRRSWERNRKRKPKRATTTFGQQRWEGKTRRSNKKSINISGGCNPPLPKTHLFFLLTFLHLTLWRPVSNSRAFKSKRYNTVGKAYIQGDYTRN